MFLSDLQNKDIISTKDGRKLGRIIDAEITPDGQILNLIIESKKSIRSLMSNIGETKVLYENIEKIGEDVILVNV